MTRPSHATAGAQATRRWRREDCPAELVIGWVPGQIGGTKLPCQAQQTWNGPHKLHHDHRWTGRINGQRVTVTWKDGRS
jgi:hypothetical protein